MGPCADITPFSGTDLEVCSLEQRPAELADQIEIMVGPTRDWSGDPDGPFATDFGLPVEVAGHLSPDNGGLGIGLEFGTPIDEALTTLQAILGAPTTNGDWETNPTCDDRRRLVSWDGLEVTFLHGPNGPTFEGYQLRAPLPPQVVIFAEPGAEGVEAGKACD